MTSELSVFAARLRDLIPLWAEPGLMATDTEFNAYALLLFALQFGRNAPYRKFCEARGVTPNSVTHWTEIPAVPTAAFKEFEMTCLRPEERTVVFHSSGTTEQRPSRHFHDAESLAIYEASLLAWFLPNLRMTNDEFRLIVLAPSPAQAPHSSLAYMFDAIRRKAAQPESVFLGHVAADEAWALDSDAATRALQAASNESTPVLVLGTAFSFVHLLDFLREQNRQFQLPPGSRVMETGGYKGRSRALSKKELHELITDRLGVPASQIVCEYGMSELSSQAYDTSDLSHPSSPDEPNPHPGPLPSDGRGGIVGRCNSNGAIAHNRQTAVEASPVKTFQFPPWARAQMVSPETGREVADGETGLVRVFDLANIFSTMAIQTEDLGIRRGAYFELIGRAAQAEQRGCSLMSLNQ